MQFLSESVRPRRAAFAPSLGARALALAVLGFGAAGAHALTFTGSSSFAYSGNVNFVSGAPYTVDLFTGFTLASDYQVGPGRSFLIGTRPFQVGLLPERINSFASENFKIVVAGGASGAPTDAQLDATVYYTIEPDPLGPEWPGAAAGGTVTVLGNGLSERDADLVGPLNSVLPSDRILAPGHYVLKTYVDINFTPGPPTAYPLAAFIELGGLSPYAGIDVSIIGVPVPEPAPAALLAAGLAVLGWRSRRALAVRAAS